MNTFQAAVIRRLTAAGLLDVAERAAKREGLMLAHVIAPGEVTGGHRVLWAALAKEKKTPAQIAELVGFPEAAVAREVAPPAPPPPPLSRPALKKAPLPVAPPPVDMSGAIHAAVAPLLARIAKLERIVADLAVTSIGADAIEAHLTRHGEAGNVVRETAVRFGVALDDLMGGRRTAAVVRAKDDVVRILTAEPFRMSQPEIAAVLRMNRTSILASQRRAGVTPANSGPARKAAA